MKLPNWLKIVWWLTLLTSITFVLSKRYDNFINGTSTPMDIFVFLIWVALLLFPLFQEVSFFGIKLTKEIDSFKNEVREQILNLRSEIQNSIQIRTQINPQFNFGPPPSDSQLPTIEKHVRKVIQETLSKHGIQAPGDLSVIEEQVPDNVQFLFLVRNQLEKEVKRLFRLHIAEIGEEQYVPISQILKILVKNEVIDLDLAGAIREVYKVCSPAIHGESFTEIQVNFIKDIGPKLITSLKALK